VDSIWLFLCNTMYENLRSRIVSFLFYVLNLKLVRAYRLASGLVKVNNINVDLCVLS